MSIHLTPIQVVERVIGPPQVIAKIIGSHAKTPIFWRRGGDLRDAGDIPSSRHMRSLLAYANNMQRPLTAEHLIFGADADEINALLAISPGVIFKARAGGPIIEVAE